MFVANSWAVWMADVVPLKVRGRYFGFRSGLALVYNTCWSIGGGALLDHFRGEQQEPLGFALLFSIACVFAFIGLMLLRKQWEPPLRREMHPSFGKLLEVFEAPSFRRACSYLFVWNFGIGIGAAFYSKYMLANLRMSFQMVLLYPVVVNLTGFACSRAWGRFMDTVGTRSTALVCSWVITFLPLIWWFARPGVLWPIWVDAVSTGIFWTGLTLANGNLPFIVTPDEHKMHYVGVFTTVSGLGMGIASLLSGKIASVLSGVQFHVPGLSHPIVNYQVIFGLSVGFRLVSLVWLTGLREQNVKCLRRHMAENCRAIFQRLRNA
jgi:Na+/melibiose symporter-like transporter